MMGSMSKTEWPLKRKTQLIFSRDSQLYDLSFKISKLLINVYRGQYDLAPVLRTVQKLVEKSKGDSNDIKNKENQ